MSLSELPKNKFFKRVQEKTNHMVKDQSQKDEKSNHDISTKSQNNKKAQVEKLRKINQQYILKKFEQKNFETLINTCSSFNTHRKLLHSEYQAEARDSIKKQIFSIKNINTVLDALESIYNNIVGVNAVTKQVLDLFINQIFLEHLQKISPDYSKFEKRFNEIISIDINNNAKTKEFKQKFKQFFDK